MSLWFSRIVSVIALYVMASQAWTDVQTIMDPRLSFHGSLIDGVTPVVAAVNALLLPFVAFLVYFAYWGRLGLQLRVAVVAVCVTGIAPLAYIVASLSVRYALPGSYMDAGLIVAAFSTAFLWIGVVLGVGLRWRRIRPCRWQVHPQCGDCSYDLTGNVSGRCPECGREFDPRRTSGEGDAPMIPQPCMRESDKRAGEPNCGDGSDPPGVRGAGPRESYPD